jgi:hypothetical protein
MPPLPGAPATRCGVSRLASPDWTARDDPRRPGEKGAAVPMSRTASRHCQTWSRPSPCRRLIAGRGRRDPSGGLPPVAECGPLGGLAVDQRRTPARRSEPVANACRSMLPDVRLRQSRAMKVLSIRRHLGSTCMPGAGGSPASCRPGEPLGALEIAPRGGRGAGHAPCAARERTAGGAANRRPWSGGAAGRVPPLSIRPGGAHAAANGSSTTPTSCSRNAPFSGSIASA